MIDEVRLVIGGAVIQIQSAPSLYFHCACCKGKFDKAPTNEAAIEELHRNFPGVKPEECELVCDECYKRFWPPK